MADQPPGLWLVAGAALGRPVPVRDKYPHICGVTVTATRSGSPYRYGGRDCAACHEQLQGRQG